MTFCADLDGWVGAGKLTRAEICTYLWLTRVAIRQKPTQLCKAIIPQLRINFNNLFKIHCLLESWEPPREVGTIIPTLHLRKPEPKDIK